MSLKKVNEEGRVVQEISAVDAGAAVSKAGLSSMREELQAVPGVVQLAGNERVQKAPKEIQAILFLKAAGYSVREIGAAFGIQENSVHHKIKRYDPNNEIKFTTRNRRELQAFKIYRLQTKILDSVNERDLDSADLRDKVTAVSMLHKLLDKSEMKEEDKPVDLQKALLDMLPVKSVVKQIPEKTT
jgi:predicted DNA-binding protein YlxM (UPF0122 family)